MKHKKTNFTHKKRKRSKATESSHTPPIEESSHTPIDWWPKIMDESFVRSAIPVGPRYQADLPNWNDSVKENSDPEDIVSDNSKWLGTRTWPVEGRSEKTDGEEIGKGRPGFCQCVSPGSVECVKHHITERRIQLQSDLGPMFWNWKFDEMGEEEVSKLWSLKERKKFESLVKRNLVSRGKSFLEPAMEKFPTKSRQSIVSYYFNVHVPQRISKQTMAGCEVADSDDDETGQARESKETRKCSQSGGLASKNAKSNFLSGRR